jgi:hypothetical protein
LTATQLLKAVSFGLYINQNDLKTKKKKSKIFSLRTPIQLMLSYRKLKIGNVGQPVILVHVTLFSLSWSFLTKKNENGFGFLDFLPCQFLCA